jgi:Fur family transcriptional regulator, ferric uptake regulator
MQLRKKLLTKFVRHILESIFQLSIATLKHLKMLALFSTHTLGHGGATYHAAEELTHLHLVCGKCGSVGDAPIDVAANFVQNLSDDYGFKTDVTHFAIYGTCAACVDK